MLIIIYSWNFYIENDDEYTQDNINTFTKVFQWYSYITISLPGLTQSYRNS